MKLQHKQLKYIYCREILTTKKFEDNMTMNAVITSCELPHKVSDHVTFIINSWQWQAAITTH